jgi:hypothetical protein
MLSFSGAGYFEGKTPQTPDKLDFITKPITNYLPASREIF